MRPTASLTGLVFAASTLLSAGCGRGVDTDPPRIAYGQAECGLCRMIISEEAFAAAVVIRESEGVRKLAFDDIGCLLDFLRDEAGDAALTPYVHDHETRQWLDATKACFVRSEALQTPMASELAATRSPEAARALIRRYPGVIASFDELRGPAATAQDAAETAREGSTP